MPVYSRLAKIGLARLAAEWSLGRRAAQRLALTSHAERYREDSS